MRKKRTIGELFLEICEKLELENMADVRIKKISCWEYYEIVKQETKDRELRRKIYKQIYHLEKIKCFDKNGLTSKGKLRLYREKRQKFLNEQIWDRKWRIVIYDIPEKKRKVRNYFRACLKASGFRLLQNSIWISPSAKFTDIQLLARECKISRYVVLIVADKVSNDLFLEKEFNIA